MKVLFTFLLLSFVLCSSCKKEDKTPEVITYPEYDNGRINLLGVTSDTLFFNSSLEFVIAANVPADRSIKVVCKPEYGNFWNGFGYYLGQLNTHLNVDKVNNQLIFSSLYEEYEDDKLCKLNGIFAPFYSSDPNEPNVGIHVIIYEDQTEWITRYITLVPN